MHVRASEIKDLSRVMDLINQAKEYFKDNDINQWQKGYPDISTILDDIISGNSYVLSKHSHTYGTMHFIIGIEPSYVRIYNGHWLTDTRHYGIIHRFAIDNNHKGNGYAKKLLDYAVNICKQSGTPSIRLDIKKNNKPMREFILKNGFKHCGTVRLKNNEEREAYERLIWNCV